MCSPARVVSGLAIELGVGATEGVGVGAVVAGGVGLTVSGAVGRDVGIGFEGARFGTGVLVGSGVGISAAVRRGVGVGVAVGAEVDAGAGLSVAVGPRSSHAMPTVTASDITPAMRIAREGGVMEGITASVRGYQTRESGRVECLCWNYCGGGFLSRGIEVPAFPTAFLVNFL